MIGLLNGRIILIKILKLEHPSSFALSTSEEGITSKNPFATWKPKPAPAEYARTKPIMFKYALSAVFPAKPIVDRDTA